MRRFAEFISGLVELVPICLHGVFGEPRRVGSVGVLGFSSPVNERVHQHDTVPVLGFQGASGDLVATAPLDHV